jgi:hypothetical protein
MVHRSGLRPADGESEPNYCLGYASGPRTDQHNLWFLQVKAMTNTHSNKENEGCKCRAQKFGFAPYYAPYMRAVGSMYGSRVGFNSPGHLKYRG